MHKKIRTNKDEHCIQVEMNGYGEDANISKNAFDTSAKNNSPKVSRSPGHHKNQASFDPSQTVAVAGILIMAHFQRVFE